MRDAESLDGVFDSRMAPEGVWKGDELAFGGKEVVEFGVKTEGCLVHAARDIRIATLPILRGQSFNLPPTFLQARVEKAIMQASRISLPELE